MSSLIISARTILLRDHGNVKLIFLPRGESTCFLQVFVSLVYHSPSIDSAAIEMEIGRWISDEDLRWSLEILVPVTRHAPTNLLVLIFRP